MNLDVQELMLNGWRKWNDKIDEFGRVLILCPLSEYHKVPDGTALESIGGLFAIKGKDYIDTDAFGGLMGYGVRA